MRIAHLVNPVKVGEDRDLYWQQPITYESMRIAKEFYNGEVEHIACFYPEDEEIVPDGFIKTELLERSTEGKFETERKLPYFREMLDKLYATSDADYFIQTNADIGLQPFFYNFVETLIEGGCDSFCINKRIIPEELQDDGLVAMWASPGKPHAGCDCFVFRRELWPKMNIGEIIMGTPWSETTLMTNMIAHAKNFDVFKNAYATFHLGDRRIWLRQFKDHRVHNTNEFARILKILSKRNKKILKHEAIVNQLIKLKIEVEGYTRQGETYSQDCWNFIQ